MARSYLCHSVRVMWRGALADLEVHTGGDGARPIELRVPALMPNPLLIEPSEAEALITALRHAVADAKPRAA